MVPCSCPVDAGEGNGIDYICIVDTGLTGPRGFRNRGLSELGRRTK